jgi:hypothetical protein
MTKIAQDDCDSIAKHPLNDSLNHLRGVLRDAAEFYKLQIISCTGTVESPDEGCQEALSKPLLALMGEKTAFNLHLKTSS